METFRTATEADEERIWEIILQAKAQMAREGKHQWNENYPARTNIREDIRRGDAHVLCRDGRAVAYGAVIFEGEPAYDGLTDGSWLSLQPYVVVHRLAVADEAKRRGTAARFLQAVEELALSQGVRSFKVDTNFDNFYMLRLLTHQGFTYCGEVRYRQGNRMAFEKLLESR